MRVLKVPGAKVSLVFNEKSEGCFSTDQLKQVLSAGAEVTLESCNYGSVDTLIDLSHYGKLKVLSNASYGSWSVDQMAEMAKAGIEILIH